MAVNELMLLHGMTGNYPGGARMAYKTYLNPTTGRFVRDRGKSRKRRKRSVGQLAGLGAGKLSIKAMARDVQSVAVTGAIAAGGAILTENAFDKLARNWDLAGWQREGAKLGVGLGLAIVIGKVLKKPRLAAAFAVGPMMVVLMNVFADIMNKGNGLSGYGNMGLTTIRPALPNYDGLGDAITIGNETPGSIRYPGRQPVRGANAVAGVM